MTAKMKKINSKSQKGRSMVEMLGVLAIMGVLSSATVNGLKILFDKHKANEILNKAYVHAISVADQINQGKSGEDLSFGGWEISSGNVQFKKPSYTSGEPTFSMLLSNVPEEVCEQMKGQLNEDSTMLLSGECNGSSDLQLIFNKDLSRGFSNSSNNGGSSGSSGGSGSSDVPPPSGEEPKPEEPTPEEPVEMCPENSSNVSTSEYLGDSFYSSDNLLCYCLTNYSYNGSECEKQNNVVSCSSYTTNECGEGRYCQFSPTVADTAPTEGVCRQITDCEIETAEITSGTYSGIYYLVGSQNECKVDWWTAQSICKSYNKKVPSLEELGCPAREDGNCHDLYDELEDADLLNGVDVWMTDDYSPTQSWWADDKGSFYYGDRTNSRSAICI